MKKIFYTFWKGSEHQPFWMPWGCLGCLGRTLLFLIMLFLLFFLLSLVVKCEDERPLWTRDGLPEEIIFPDGEEDSADEEESEGYYDPEKDESEDGVGEDSDDTGVEEEDEESEDATGSEEKPGSDSDGDSKRSGKEDKMGMIPEPGPYLPTPDKNILPPVEEDEIIEDEKEKRRIVGNKLNVILDSGADDETFKLFAKEFKEAYPGDDYQVVYYNTLTKLIQLSVPADQRERVKRRLPRQIPDISFKVFDETMFEGAGISMPDDIGFEYEQLAWYFEPIQTYDAWEITQGSPEVVIAVVDSYFDMTHCELEHSRIVKPYSVRFRGRDVRPTRDCPKESPAFFHGTAVAAQAVGAIDNRAGLCGIAPKCRLMPVSMGHQFTSMTILEGLLYAIYQGANVVNISAGAAYGEMVKYIPIQEQIEISKHIGKEEEEVWQYAFDLADERNVTIVWASGNSTIYSGLDFSKRGKNTVRVAAVDNSLERADFSNWGNVEEQDLRESTISAPGTQILAASPFNSFGIGDGTSYSAPIVAGAIGLMKSIDPTLTNKQIIEILQETGKPIKNSPEIGPLLQIKDALLKVKGQFVAFDDIMKDHNLLIGTWQTTELLTKIDGSDGMEYPNEVRLFFQISDVTAGELKLFEATTTKHVFSAPLGVVWGEDNILLQQHSKAMCPDTEEKYESYVFTCTPDKEGLLQCEHEGKDISSDKYYVKKISNNPNIDITSYE